MVKRFRSVFCVLHISQGLDLHSFTFPEHTIGESLGGMDT